jgi:hypothetical protein
MGFPIHHGVLDQRTPSHDAEDRLQRALSNVLDDAAWIVNLLCGPRTRNMLPEQIDFAHGGEDAKCKNASDRADAASRR